jgi:hypothetical protein
MMARGLERDGNYLQTHPVLIQDMNARCGMAKFKIVLERTDTVTKQAEIMVEAATAEQAQQFIIADLEVDAGSYDDDLRAVESEVGDMKVTVAKTEKPHVPTHIPRAMAG